MIVRPAILSDAPGVSEMLYALKAAGKRTRPCDQAFVETSYIANPRNILCALAVDDGHVMGLQSLTHAYEGNPYGAALGMGIIGTHVSPQAARRGVGRALFEATKLAAVEAGLTAVEAFIQTANAEGHAYYGAMGFLPVREDGSALIRRWDLP